jgi:hypothetical protein
LHDEMHLLILESVANVYATKFVAV